MKLKHWLKILIFALLTVLMLAFATVFLAVPYARDSAGMYGFRLEPENSLDVVLIGASNIYTGFYAPLAYEEKGFTSYPVAVGAMAASNYQTAVEETLSGQDPELFVVELWGFQYPDQYTEYSMHTFLDVLPFYSDARKNAISSIEQEDLRNSFSNPLELYHNNWRYFVDCCKVLIDKLSMKKRGYSIIKNYSVTTTIVPELFDVKYVIPDVGLKLLGDFLDFCHEKGISDILFIRGPEAASSEPPDESYNTALTMIAEAGYDFLDVNSAENGPGIDPYQDWQYTGHLNVFGTEKYTRFLSDYIMSHYEIDTSHSEQVTSMWDHCASFNDEILGRLEAETLEKKDVLHFTHADMLAGSGS